MGLGEQAGRQAGSEWDLASRQAGSEWDLECR